MYQVYLSKNQIKKACAVHRLVAEAFIYNDDVENKTTVNHKDGDRSNNKVDNLEWSSYSENLQHAYNILDRPVNKSKNKPVKPGYKKKVKDEIERVKAKHRREIIKKDIKKRIKERAIERTKREKGGY